MKQIERIRRMERYLDESMTAIQRLNSALDEYASVREKLHSLAGYYDSGTWREDYEADERGELPPDMKRGVLPQDALYDLLEGIGR